MVIYVCIYMKRRGVEGGERACPWLPTACVELKKLRRRDGSIELKVFIATGDVVTWVVEPRLGP